MTAGQNVYDITWVFIIQLSRKYTLYVSGVPANRSEAEICGVNEERRSAARTEFTRFEQKRSRHRRVRILSSKIPR